MYRETFLESEAGASETIGELMMIAITVTFFAVLSVAVVAIMMSPSQPIRMNVQASMADGHEIAIKNSGGDCMGYASVSIIVNGIEYTYGSQSMGTDDTNKNGRWDTGEAILVPASGSSKANTVLVYEKQSGTLIGKLEVSG